MKEFTKDEIIMLKEHTEKIINFLLPFKKYLREYHTISFGYNKYGNYDYRITISPNRIYGGIGRCSIALESDDTTHDYTLNSSYSVPDYMAKLCYEWKTIKPQILSIVEEEKRITESINNFEL